MEIASSLSALVNNTSTQQLSVVVLKKALDIQAQAALSLIEAIPQASSTGSPPNLGQNINTTA